MIKFIKILPLLLLVGAGGLFGYQKINTKTTVADWIGEYDISKVHLAERKYLFKKHHIKGAYFSSVGSISILLNSDFTFNSLQVAGNNDTINYNGKWELINEKPLLHFLNKQYYLNQLPLTGKVYYYEKVKTCEGDTINHFAVFKKVK